MAAVALARLCISPTIVALMSRRNSMVKTFSVGFGEGPYSELSYAARASAGQE